MKILNACKVGMALTAAAFLGLATAQRADAISFSLTDLGTLGGNSSYASAINELGQVAGTSSTTDGQSRAFFWDNSSGMTNLGTLPAGDYNYCYSYYGYGYDYGPCPSSSYSSATAINDLGQVIGTSSTYYGGYYRGYEQNGFFWDKSSGMISLGTPGGGYGGYSYATAINNLGQVIGNTSGYRYGQYPFLWEKNTGITNLVTPGGYYGYGYSYATAINNLGQVVGTSSGYSEPYYGYRQYPFLWEKNSGISNLGTLGGYYGSASAINDLGQVVGYSSTADGQTRAFFWDNSSGMINLGTLGAYDSYGYISNYSYSTAINNLGQVIGYSTSANGPNRPFFWDKNSGMSDVNDLISDLGWTLNSVVGINNAGQIVGNGFYNGQQRAFVLTPKSVPEPSSALAFLALGAVGAGSWAKRQRQQQEASSRN